MERSAINGRYPRGARVHGTRVLGKRFENDPIRNPASTMVLAESERIEHLRNFVKNEMLNSREAERLNS